MGSPCQLSYPGHLFSLPPRFSLNGWYNDGSGDREAGPWPCCWEWGEPWGSAAGIGQMGLSAMVTKGNLSAVDNRHGRAGVFMLLSPVQGLAATAISLVFNTIEFLVRQEIPSPASRRPWWIRGRRRHQGPASTWIRPSTKVPLAMPPQGCARWRMPPDAHTAQMEIHYLDGRRGTLRGEMHGDLLHLYLDDKLISTLSRQQLDEMSRGASCLRDLPRGSMPQVTEAPLRRAAWRAALSEGGARARIQGRGRGLVMRGQELSGSLSARVGRMVRGRPGERCGSPARQRT